MVPERFSEASLYPVGSKDREATTWSSGPGRQYKITAVLCEGAGAIFTKLCGGERHALKAKLR